MHFDLTTILPAIGYLGILAIVFAESGLLIGFFFPGDSLLFTAGFLASQAIFDIRFLAAGCFAAAVLGDSVGYALGHKVGRRLFRRQESFFFHKNNLIKAEEFYEKYGKKTIVIARFLPVIRTFAPIVAGIGSMNYPTFLSFNVVGGALWAVGLTLAGYFLGTSIPGIDRYLLPIILVIIFLSILPTLIHILKDEEIKQHLFLSIRRMLKIQK